MIRNKGIEKMDRERLARSIEPSGLDSPDDEGRAIPRNVVITKHRDDG
jgi:hypothetical protein